MHPLLVISRHQRAHAVAHHRSWLGGISWPFLKLLSPKFRHGHSGPDRTCGCHSCIRHWRPTQQYDLGRPTGQWREISLAALLNITFWHIFSAFGIKLLGGGQASIIAYTMPLWAVLFSTWPIGETLTLARMAGLVLHGRSRRARVVERSASYASSPLGALFMLTAACAWGAGTTLQKKVKWKISPVSFLLATSLAVCQSPLLHFLLMLEAGNQSPPRLYFQLFCPGISDYPVLVRLVYNRGSNSVAVSTVSILAVPALGVGSSVLVLGEAIGWREIASLLLICTAIVLVLKPDKSAKTYSD